MKRIEPRKMLCDIIVMIKPLSLNQAFPTNIGGKRYIKPEYDWHKHRVSQMVQVAMNDQKAPDVAMIRLVFGFPQLWHDNGNMKSIDPDGFIKVTQDALAVALWPKQTKKGIRGEDQHIFKVVAEKVESATGPWMRLTIWSGEIVDVDEWSGVRIMRTRVRCPLCEGSGVFDYGDDTYDCLCCEGVSYVSPRFDTKGNPQGIKYRFIEPNKRCCRQKNLRIHALGPVDGSIIFRCAKCGYEESVPYDRGMKLMKCAGKHI